MSVVCPTYATWILSLIIIYHFIYFFSSSYWDTKTKLQYMEDAFPFTYQNKWRCHHFQHFYNFYLLFTRIIDCVVKPNMSLLRVFDGRLSFDIVAEGKNGIFTLQQGGKIKPASFLTISTLHSVLFFCSLSVF